MGLFPNTALDTFDCNAAEPKVRKVNNSGAIVSFSNQGAIWEQTPYGIGFCSEGTNYRILQ
ncbi:MAG: hypothetical protein UU63_C0054G0002 [Candidatus Uhrbacteria bacterium GW2011_GWF2_41_430]|nr:MAG: hypothetical protein UU63_C0054G0002 [Candidatus Uhrbacteria bacterium GW2011_GWF2_41_430]